MSERTISFHNLSEMDADARARLLVRSEADLAGFVAKVQPIIDRVRAEGDAALAHFAREFDKADLSPDRIRATEDDFDRAFAQLEPEVLDSIE